MSFTSAHAEIQEAFAAAAHIQAPLPPEATYMSSEKAHGRAEVRRVTAMNVDDYLSCKEDWKGLRSIVLVERERTLGSETSKEVHYYISSHEANAEALGARIRGHWGIENEQHWTLDMAFDEDRCRIRTKNGPDNFALLRRFALNLLKAETSSKRGIEGKRKKAGWDTTYLLKVLEQVASTYPK